MAIDLTKLSTILTSHDGTAALNELNLKDSTSQKIKDYFTQQTRNKKPADTLAEIAAYDTNHDGKIDKSERQAAGLTCSQAKAFNKALKSLQTENNLTAERGVDNNTTDYKDAQGKKVFSITTLNNGTKTTFYDKDGNVTKTVTEDENGITTEETNGNTKTTTTEYSDAKIAQNGGVKKKVEDVTTNADGKTTTTEIKYHSNGNLSDIVYKFADGSTTEIKYDENQNFLSSIHTYADGTKDNTVRKSERKDINDAYKAFKGLENYNFECNGANVDCGMVTVNGERVLIFFNDGKYNLTRFSLDDSSGKYKVIFDSEDIYCSSIEEVKNVLDDKNRYWGNREQGRGPDGQLNFGDFIF